MARRVLVAVPYCREILRGIAEYMHAHEAWSIDRAPSWAFEGKSEELADWPGHGFIIQFAAWPAAEAIRSLGKPVVCVSDLRADWPFPMVHSDNEAIGRMGEEHFQARGFRQLLFVGIAGAAYSQQRGDGFEAAAREAAIACVRLELDPETEIQRDAGVARLGELLQQMPKPLAIQAANDGTAEFVSRVCREAGLAVPAQVAILGVDNDDVTCGLSAVPLSSIQPAFDRIGYEAAHVLSAMMRGEARPRQPVLIPPLGVVTRQSTDVVAAQDPEVARALMLIQQRAGTRYNVKQLVAELCCSRRSLERRFKQALGRSPSDVLLGVQMVKAMELLRTTDTPIPSVARAAGFTDMNHLGRCFRRKMNISPRAYRRQFKPV